MVHSIAMELTRLPPGFRFHPTDVELVLGYLKRKVLRKKLHKVIAEVNIYKFSPWDLPDKSCWRSKDQEWYFFCPRENKYASGDRVKRATENGYWKTTGKDRSICYKGKTIGNIKTLVFHLGKAPKGERTDWVIHEYKILDNQLAATGIQDTYVLCKVFKKAGPGPMNGAQYGAPFNEEEWSDADDDDAPSHAIEPTTSVVPPAIAPSAGCPNSEVVVDEIDDEMPSFLALVGDHDMVLSDENGIIDQGDVNVKGKNKSPAYPADYDIYSELGYLDSWTQMNCGLHVDSSGLLKDYFRGSIPIPNDQSYIEWNDFRTSLNSSTIQAIGSPDQAPVSEIVETNNHDSSTNMHSGASCSYQQPAFFKESCEGCAPLNVLQMIDNQFYQGSDAAFNLGSTWTEPVHGGDVVKGKNKSPAYSADYFRGLHVDSSGLLKDYFRGSIPIPNDQSYIELNDFRTSLNSSTIQAIGSPDQAPVSEIVETNNHDSITNMHSGASCSYQQPAFFEESCEGCAPLNVLQMIDNQFYQGSDAAFNLSSTWTEPVHGVKFKGMERGTHRKIRSSRLLDSAPARTPSAAAHLTHSFNGSSMHIKAEVTHGAGECTNEALLFMMEGSSSCWCNLPLAVSQEILVWYWDQLVYLVDFCFHLVLGYCCFNLILLFLCPFKVLIIFVLTRLSNIIISRCLSIALFLVYDFS